MKSTKKSLVLSTLSLIMCVAMLLGTTYAWFTDSVTSGKNIITAGNLDVELLHYTSDAASATTVQDKTDLFKVALWEPGVIAYENFVVSNVGNLALKYALNLNVFDKNTYNGHDLTEVIKVAVVNGGFTGDRAAAQALPFETLADFQKTGNLEGGDSTGDTFGVVLYWQPTDHDNDYNVNNYTGTRPTSDGQPLFVEFGVNLVATQDTVEADSFDKYYDKNATFKANATATAETGKETKFVVPVTPSNEGGSTTVTFPADVLDDGENSMTVEASPVLTANNKFTVNAGGAVGAIDLTVKAPSGNVISEFKDGNSNPVSVTVETYVAKNLTNVSLKYNGEGVQPTDVTYDKTTGKLSFKTPHFSTFVLGADEVAYVEENNTAYLTLEEAAEYADGKSVTVELLKNIDFSDKYAVQAFHRFIFENDIVNLNGYSISNRNASIVFDGDNMLIKNGKFIGTNGASYGLFIGDGIYEDRISTGIVVEDIEFVGGLNIFEAEVTIREMVSTSTANATSYYAVWGDAAADITVESGTFKSESTKGGSVIHAYNGGGSNPGEPAKVVIKGGNYIALNEKVEMCGEGIEYIQIQGGTFNRDPSANVAVGYKAIDNKDGTWTVVAK